MTFRLAFVGCLLGLTTFNYYIGRKNVLCAAFLFSLIWPLVFCLSLVPLVEIGRVRAGTIAVVLAGAVAFSANGALVARPGGFVRLPLADSRSRAC